MLTKAFSEESFISYNCGGMNNGPQRSSHPNLGPVTMVPKIKSNSVEVVKLLVLRKEDYAGLSKGANAITSILP